jgi:tripartite-type tricarboxylate transporter receptor subunit TctC
MRHIISACLTGGHCRMTALSPGLIARRPLPTSVHPTQMETETMQNISSARLLLAAVFGLALGLSASARADDYPSKPIKIVVPYPPGSGVDTMARTIAEKFREKWGQPVIVDNRGGAAGNIGAAYFAKSAPDGYTLMVAPPAPLVVNKSLYPKLPYDPDEFVPVSLLTVSPSVLVVNPKVGIDSQRQLIAHAKANPERMTYASSGSGGTTHLSSELFASMAGIKLTHLPYKGAGLALNDVVAGHVDMMMSEVGLVLPFIQAGRLRALGIGSEKRNRVLPDVPVIGEVLPGFVSLSWNGMVAPAGTPPAIVNKVSAAVADIMKHPDVASRLKDLSVEGIGSTPAEMAKFMKQEHERWANVIRVTGARPD